jgi:hypothetical protein
MKDVTEMLEREESKERHVGVSIQSLSAFMEFESDSGSFDVEVHGELVVSTGETLSEDLMVVCAVYDENSRIVGSSEAWMDTEKFFGSEVFNLIVQVPSCPARIPVSPVGSES